MALGGLKKSSVVLDSVAKLLLEWENHCKTLHSLADQIMGLEKCEKEMIHVPVETYPAVQMTIQSKIMEELNSLSEIIEHLKSLQSDMADIRTKAESCCQQRIEENNTVGLEYRELQIITSICNYITLLTGMKQIPLLKSKAYEYTSLQEFKKINAATKPTETELEKLSYQIKRML